MGTSYDFTTFTTWPPGAQITAGDDPTGRPNSPEGDPVHPRTLILGMGNPLEPAPDYYVGVFNHGAVPMDYTVRSRGIGDGFEIPIVTLEAGGPGSNVTDPSLTVREARYYSVEVPAGAPSWRFQLTANFGEALLLLQKDIIPGSLAGPTNQDVLLGGRMMHKDGNEHFLMLPLSPATTLEGGTYQLSVISEGVNPSGTSIGTEGLNYTLASLGPLPVSSLGTVPALGAPDFLQPATVSLEGGTVHAYTFTIPEGAGVVEVLLDEQINNPVLMLRKGDVVSHSSDAGYYGVDGGLPPEQQSENLISLPNPEPGLYTLVVRGQSTGTTIPDPSYKIRLRQRAAPILNFHANLNAGGGSHIATGELNNGQSAFYKVTVPASNLGQPVLGWRIDLSESYGNGLVRVRKDEYPQGLLGSPFADRTAVISPPYLTPGDWFVEVLAAGATGFTITSSQVLLDHTVWQMPVAGQPVTTPGLPPASDRFSQTPGSQGWTSDKGISITMQSQCRQEMWD